MTKQGRGLYQRGGVWWLSFQKNHKRHWVTLETDDYATAILKAEEVKAAPELNTGGKLAAETVRYRTSKLAAEEFTRDTAANVAGFLARLVEHFGDITPGQVTAAGAQGYYDRLIKDGMTVISARTYVGRAASFFAWCVQDARTVRTNPFTELKNGKLVSRLKMADVVSAARKEFCEPKLRDQLIKDCPREDLRFVLYCGFHAGLRRKEICEARPCWFDLSGGLLHIRKIDGRRAAAEGLDPFDLKDKEERTIPLSKAFRRFLRTWLDPKGAYCLDPDGRRGRSRYRYDFRRPFDLYMAAQGREWVTPHTMRRTFASLQVSHGTDIYHVAKWLGDDIKTTMKHYAHLMPDHAQLEQGLRRKRVVPR